MTKIRKITDWKFIGFWLNFSKNSYERKSEVKNSKIENFLKSESLKNLHKTLHQTLANFYFVNKFIGYVLKGFSWFPKFFRKIGAVKKFKIQNLLKLAFKKKKNAISEHLHGLWRKLEQLIIKNSLDFDQVFKKIVVKENWM